MSFRRGGGGKRRDAIEPEIIRQLNARGAMVWQISGFAQPDLLTLYQGRWKPLGVKSGPKARLTDSEQMNPPLWPLVFTVEAAVAEVCGPNLVWESR